MGAIQLHGDAVSSAGSDLSSIMQSRRVRVVFLNTRGGGATPWRNWIALDLSYLGEGQVLSADRIALVAHELTHVLQRELKDPNYWPTGGFRLSKHKRWLGDSTNYMEVLANIIGASVEYDLLLGGLDPAPTRERDRRRLILSNRLATLTGDPQNATRSIVKNHPKNHIYLENYRYESTLSDRRIPHGGWDSWLNRLGFSTASIRHIERLAGSGTVDTVSVEELEQILDRA